MKNNIEQDVKILKVFNRDIREKLVILESKLIDLQKKYDYLLNKMIKIEGGKNV